MGARISGTTGIDDGAGGPATLVGQSAAKVWSNLNGSGTITERDSFQTSSVVDNGIGQYTFNFSSSFGNANYSLSTAANYDSGTVNMGAVAGPKRTASPFITSSADVSAGNSPNAALADLGHTLVTFHGDLA